MSLGLMLVTLSAAMLATQPAAFVQSSKTSFEFKSTEVKGVAIFEPELNKVQFKAKIKSKQCSGSVKFGDYECRDPHGPFLPEVLKVHVLDNTGPAEVHISHDLKWANIYRVSRCNATCEGPAIVIVSVAC